MIFMHKAIILLLFSLMPGWMHSQQAVFDWALACGNPPNTTDTRTCLASGPYGTFVLAGEFLNTASFGDHSLASQGGTDVFITTFTSGGDVISALSLGGDDYDFVRDVRMDAAGNIYLLGYFYGSIQLGSSLFTSYGSQDVFLAMIDEVGKVSWARHIGGSMADYPAGIALDGEGGVLVAGYFYNQVSIGDTTLYTQASSDVYLARFGGDGEFLDVVQAGGSSSDQLSSVTVDADHHITIVGSFYGDFTIGDTTFTTLNPVGIFLAGLTPELEIAWAFQLDGTYLNPGVLAASDQDGEFYIAGSFSEEIHFRNVTFSAGEFNQDVFLAKYDGAGDVIWARHGHSRSSDDVTGLGVDSDNNVYVTGHFLDSLHFDDLMLPYTLCCGSREVYVVNYTREGRPWWGEQVSGPRTTHQAMTVTSEEKVLLSGIFTEDVIFGSDTLSYFDGYRNFVTGLTGDVFTFIPAGQKDPGLKIYPNPARDLVRVSAQQGSVVRLELFTVQGSLVRELRGENLAEFTVSGLDRGCYILRITTDTGSSESLMLMVVH